MLHSYSFRNFQSFKEWTNVSLALGARSSTKSWTKHAPSGQLLSTALAIFGANASGKTALLKPLGFASHFIGSSFSDEANSPIPFTPHFSAPDEPFEIVVEAEDELGTVLKYELRATTKRVIHEALYQKKTRYAYLFVRDWNDTDKSYDIKQQGFGLPAAQAKSVRQNASLISTANQYGVDVSRYLNALLVTASNINLYGRWKARTDSSIACSFFREREHLRQRMVSLIKTWDLGISDITIHEIDRPSATKSIDAKNYEWRGVHKLDNGSEVLLPMHHESSGTQSAVVLLSRLLSALEVGGVALIDEMESDLHPHLVLSVLDLFAREATNPFGAQMIFTCHSTPVLDLLSKSQVIFVERDATESHAYRGDEIEGLRSDDNLRSKYESGALGAVPNT